MSYNNKINKSLSQEVQTEFFAKNSVIPWFNHGTQVIKTLLFVRALHA